MDRIEHNSAFCQPFSAPNPTVSAFHQSPNQLQLSDSRLEAEVKDPISARKVQKADREKLRRDRLNEQFSELGSTLDPGRPKNDKASILSDTIQILKDLTDQVNRLKDEHAALTEEARELTQEKNDLRDEKTSIKSDIESLNVQYQQRLRAMYPWAGMDHSMVMHPSAYPFPVPVPVTSGPIPMHPSMQPYPFFANQNPAVVSPCSPFVPYLTPTTILEQQSTQYVAPVMQPASRSHISSKQDSRNKSPDLKASRIEKSEESNDVTTDLELKTPGSTADQDSPSGGRKSKRIQKSLTEESSSSRCSSSPSVQASSSNSMIGVTKADD